MSASLFFFSADRSLAESILVLSGFALLFSLLPKRKYEAPAAIMTKSNTTNSHGNRLRRLGCGVVAEKSGVTNVPLALAGEAELVLEGD